MRIKVSKIPEEGLELNFDKSRESISNELRESDWLRKGLLKPLHVEAEVSRTGSDVFIQGIYATEVEPTCDRCLEQFQTEVHGRMQVTCIPDNRQVEDDVDVFPYKGDEIDVGEIAREQFMLTLPIQNICKDGCLGLCDQCGKNLNQELCGCRKGVSAS